MGTRCAIGAEIGFKKGGAMSEKVRILVTLPMPELTLAAIAGVDPRVSIIQVTPEVNAELGIAPAGTISREQRPLIPTLEEASRRLDDLLSDTQVIFGSRLPRDLLKRAPYLKWVQAASAGVDRLLGNAELMASRVMITRNAGGNTVAVAEFAVCQMLMLVRQAPRYLRNQAARYWEPFRSTTLDGKVLGVIGLGRIGGEIARLARVFGMKVLAIRREVSLRQPAVAGVAELFPPGELMEMLPRCDYVVLAVPLTPQTRGLIGEAELRAMKSGAYLINVARGPVVQQAVLLRALKEKWLAGAALDVFETEPLPSDSEFWALDNVIISPHIAGRQERPAGQRAEPFSENLRRFLRGERLLNLVDKERGY